MLLMAALEPGDPMTFVVLAKADDAAIRHWCARAVCYAASPKNFMLCLSSS